MQHNYNIIKQIHIILLKYIKKSNREKKNKWKFKRILNKNQEMKS